MSPKRSWWMLMVVIAVCSSEYAEAESVSSIGAPIRRETAQAWIKSFELRKPGAVLGHMYGKPALQELLALEGVDGFHIFKGLDDGGSERLIFKAAGAGGEVIHNDVVYDASYPCPPCAEADITNIGERVDEVLAEQWIKRYQSRAPSTARSHLYGRKGFEQLLAQEGTEGVYFAYGLGPDASEHLILVGVDGKGRVMWEGLILNAGHVCPPVCPE
jgi:hypothetical protein